MVGIDIKARSFQAFCDKRKKVDILEDPSAQDDSVQTFLVSDRLAGLNDKASNGSMELS